MNLRYDIYGDLFIIFLTLGYIFFYTWEGNISEIVGVSMTGCALLLWIKARLDLGTSFSIRPRTNELVTRGLYTKIRNPMYVFGAVAIFGLLLALNNPYLYPFFVVLLVVQFFRARKEEKALVKHFGDTYLKYKEGTWF